MSSAEQKNIALLSDTLSPLFDNAAVEKAWLFGSVARGEAAPESDLDVVVTFRSDMRYSLFDLSSLEESVSKAVCRPAHLMTEYEIHPEIRSKIAAERILVYDKTA